MSRAQYLHALNIPEWVLRKDIAPTTAESSVAHIKDNHTQVESIADPVSETVEPSVDTSASFEIQGTGNIEADCILLGNIAAAEDDTQAFSVEEQTLLENMLKSINLTTDKVFTVKPLVCLATALRDPQEQEIEKCQQYIFEHIRVIQPKALLVMNQLLATILLGEQQTIAKLSGKVHEISGFETRVIVTYPPTHLLKKPLDKRKAWQDLKQLREILNE